MTEKIKSFVQLIVWQEGHKLVMAIYKLTEDYPKKEIFGLTNQIRRAGVSITSNIAEGFTRRSQNEKIRFYSITQGSLVETQNQLIISRDLKYLSENNFRELINRTIRINKLINGLIRSCKN